MNKKKILLGVFLAMFIVPEVLWSPVGNFVYEWSQNTNHVVPLRANFLTQSDNVDLWSRILLFQFFGLLLSAICLLWLKKHFNNQAWFWVLFVVLTIATTLLLFVYGLSDLSGINPIF